MIASGKTRLTKLWKATQVELQGSYSTQRVQALLNYSTNVSNIRVLIILLITPLPCLGITTAVDSVHLRPIEEGIDGSHRFFARALIAFWIVGIVTYFQFRHGVPQLPLSSMKIIVISAIVAVPTVGAMYGLALVIGFPLPFSLITVSPAWLTLLVVPIAPWVLKAQADPVVWPLVTNMVKVLTCLEVFVIIYPVYFYVFTIIPASGKTSFAMLLPVMKLTFRRMMSRTAVHLRDEIPMFVILNVEVFSALFVAYCMQNTPSVQTTLGLMAFDALQMLASLYDIGAIVRRLKILRTQIDGISSSTKAGIGRKRAKSEFYLAQDIFKQQGWPGASSPIGAVSPLPSAILKLSPMVKPLNFTGDKTKKTNTHWISITPHTDSTGGAIACDDPMNSFPGMEVLSKLEPLSKKACQGQNSKNKINAITATSELRYMQELCNVLYITEFVVLLNYVEVIVPIIFSVYLITMYHLPNRAYYEQIASMDDVRFGDTLFNVLLYAMLQLLSLGILNVVLWHQMRFSVVRQLAFVLETEWSEVQAKLLFWVFYHVQASLQHFGSDYTFKFAWLRKNS